VKLHAKRRHKQKAHGVVWKHRFSVSRYLRSGTQSQHVVRTKQGKEC